MTPSEILAWRKRHGLTQQQCADMIYITVRHWSRVEHGVTRWKTAWEAILTLKTDQSVRFRKQVEKRLHHLESRRSIK